MKQKIAFALIMGTITTGIISYVLISINIAWAHTLLKVWLKAWLISYILVIPIILLISPIVQKVVEGIFPLSKGNQ